jgi:O-antigen ligase
VLAFCTYVGIRYFQAEVEYAARIDWTRCLVYTALFFVVLNNAHRKSSIQILVGVLLVVGVAVSAYAIWQFIADSNFVYALRRPEQYDGRGSGTYICPNHLAGFLELLAPVAIAGALAGKSAHLVRIGSGYAGLVLVAGIGVSVSRGAWIACALAVGLIFTIVFMAHSWRTRIALLVVGIVASVVAVIGFRQSEFIQQRFNDTFRVEGQIADMRWNIWSGAINIWKQEPWLGVGPNHFNLHFPNHRPGFFQMSPERAHNDYLNVLADHGIIGFALFTLIGASLIWAVVVIWPHLSRRGSETRGKRSGKYAYVLGIVGGLSALLFHSMTDFNLHVPANAALATALAAILVSHLRHATNTWWVKPGKYGAFTAALILLPLSGYLSLQAGTLWQEQRILAELDDSRTGPEHIDTYKRAFAIDPHNGQTALQIGELLRKWSWEGDDNHVALAEEAADWFRKSLELNPYEYTAATRLGMTLDWIYRYDEAEPWFQRAETLDPTGYFTMAQIGWHALQLAGHHESLRDPDAERAALERSLRYFEESKRLTNLAERENTLADDYLRLVKRRLARLAEAR